MGKTPAVIQVLPELNVPDRTVSLAGLLGSRSGSGSRRLPPPLLAGFFEIAVRAKSLHETFLVHDLLQTFQRLLDRFASLQLNLEHGS